MKTETNVNGKVEIRVKGRKIFEVTKAGRQYWLVEDYSQGHRRLFNAKDETAARAKAKALSEAVVDQRQDLLGLDTDMMAREWIAAMKVLDGKGSVLEAARFFVSNGGPDLTPTKVSVVVAEQATVKQAQGTSAGHLGSTKCRLARFEKGYGNREIHTLTTAEIETFILGLAMAPRTRNQVRKAIANLYAFAQTRGYVAKDFNPAKASKPAKVVETEVTFFTPDQMKKLLAACQGKLEGHLPLVVLCGFAGLRPSEAARVTWQMVGADFIRLPGSITKTGKGRLVPVLPCLSAWLAPLRQTAGLVVNVDVAKAPRALTRASGVAWTNDALRHSYGTFRHAELRNVAQLVEEMGNSIPIARRHYINPMITAEQGKAWFSILPSGSEKITTLQVAAGA